MYPIPSNETLVETKVCKHCGSSFPITDKDMELLAALSPTIAEKKEELPTPEFCPECCRIHRLVWRNEKKIYKRLCNATSKSIISIFPPTSQYKIYEESVWNSDYWNAKDYGRDFDFSRPFFEQFSELLRVVPIASKATRFCENSDYCNAATSLKNCYLTFSANTSEGLLYTVDAVDSNFCVDCLGIYQSEQCYECSLALRCFNVSHSYDVQDCLDSQFLLSCRSCSNCYGCFSLENKRFYIFNIEHTQEEYEKKLNKILETPFSEGKKQFEDFYQGKYIKPPLANTGSENVTDGENIVNSANISHSRHINGAQNVRYCQKLQVPGVDLAMHYNSFGGNVGRVYFSQQIGNNAHNVYFSIGVFNDVQNIFYCVNCRNGVQNCFGCAGLKNAESYCIFNKQYTKEEYNSLVLKIVEHMRKTGEWGNFFPPRISYHGYNEAVTGIVVPLDRDEALERGFNWSDYEPPFPKVEKIIPANKLPEDITKIPDDILNWAIECEVTQKPFRIIKQELEFYRKHNLPIPRRHPDQRYIERFTWYNNY